MKIIWQGLCGYHEGLERQRELHAEVRAGGPDVLLAMEHPGVITLGRRAQACDEVLPSSSIEVVTTDRGGQATLHSPGQLVIYPIVDLRRANISIKSFVGLLLETTARVLRSRGIAAEADLERAGVFTREGKIAFCGLRVENGVTRHGLSLNVLNNLNLFNQIRSCGVASAALSSWAEYKNPPELEEIFSEWRREFEPQLSSNAVAAAAFSTANADVDSAVAVMTAHSFAAST